ncbi:hypothetical protein FRC06_004912 [Ceratobasidium sp. 370]|nr:hypothetical protein FRC06_004912 [Ceratobasidium sp. 370]
MELVGTDDQGWSGEDRAESKHVPRAHDPAAPGKLSESSGYGDPSTIGAALTATYEEEETPDPDAVIVGWDEGVKSLRMQVAQAPEEDLALACKVQEQAWNHLVQLLVLSTFAEHNVTEVLNDMLQREGGCMRFFFAWTTSLTALPPNYPVIHTYPDLASQSTWAQLIVLLRCLETPSMMDAFNTYLTHHFRPIDKVFLSLFTPIFVGRRDVRGP